jgi:hypothetical protein
MAYLKKFHAKVVSSMNSGGVYGLQKTAWQIEEYLEQHGKYIDSEFIRTLQESLEKVIRKKLGSKWSVDRNSARLNGRTTGVNQYAPKYKIPRKIPVPNKLSQEINKRILEKSAEARRDRKNSQS